MNREKAEAFTQEHGHKKDGMGPSWSATINWHSTNKGKPQCRAGVRDPGPWPRWGQCVNVGKVQLEDGSTWCGMHAPEAVARRKAKSDAHDAAQRAEWARKIKARTDAAHAARAYPLLRAALEAIRDGDNDARGTARAALEEVDK